MALVLFIFEIILAISYDNEDSVKNIGLILVMYFSYCQLWIYIVIKAAYSEYILKEKRTWAKTVRFDVEKPKEKIPADDVNE
jgi:hypothetical protein